MAALFESLGKVTQRMTDTHKESHRLTKGMKDLKGSFGSLTSAAIKLSVAFGAGKIFQKWGSELVKLNKQMFDISKTSKVTGQSFVAMERAIKDLNASTYLSRQESTQFFRTMQKGQRGIRINAQETSKLAKVLSNEYGPALDNISEGLNDLLSLQQKEINVLRRVQSGMDPHAVRSYGASLMMVHGATEKEIEALIRVSRAYRAKSRTDTESETKNIKLAKSLQSIKQAGQDLLIEWAKPMADSMIAISKAAVGVRESLSNMIKGDFAKKLIALAPFLGLGVAGAMAGRAGTNAVRGIGGFAGSMFGLDRGKGRGGGRGRGRGKRGPAGVGLDSIRLQNGAMPVYIVGSRFGGGGGRDGGMEFGDVPSEPESKRGKKKKSFRKRLSRRAGHVGRVMGVGGAAVAGGYVAGMAGEALMGQGHTRLGAGLSAAGGIVSGAGAGAMLGSLFGPVGTALGGFTGALIGAANNLDNLSTALFGLDEEQKKNKKSIEAKRLAEERSVMVMKTRGGMYSKEQRTEFKATYGRHISKEFGGKKFAELGVEQQERAMSITKARTDIAKRASVQMDEHTRMLAVKMRDLMARDVARGKGVDRGLTGGALNTFTDKLVKEFHKGRSTVGFEQEVEKGLGGDKGGIRGRAEKALGIKAPQEEIREAMEDEKTASYLRNLSHISAEYQQIKLYTESLIGSHLKMADVAFQFSGNIQSTRKHYDAAQEALSEQTESLKGILGKLRMITKGGKLEGKNKKEIETYLKSQNKSEKEISDILSGNYMTLSMMSQVESDIAQKKLQKIEISSHEFSKLAEIESLQSSRIGILESELAISKALFLGLGPTLDKQIELSDELDRQKGLIQDQIDARMNIRPEERTVKIKKEILELQQRQNNLELKRLNITKNLREAYLQSMQAFTNVQGFFSKIILKKEMGMGEILRQFGGPGGIKAGALGAGMRAPAARLQPGGGVEFAGRETWRRGAQRYDPGMILPPRRRFNIAAASKETGSERAFRGRELHAQTGLPVRGVSYINRQHGGVVPGSGKGDIVPAMLEPGEVVVSNEMQKNMKGSGTTSAIVLKLEAIRKLQEQTLSAIKKRSIEASKNEKDELAGARRDKQAKQSDDRKRVKDDQKSKEAERQGKLESKLLERNEEWKRYFTEHSTDRVMKGVNTSGVSISSRRGGGVSGVGQHLRAKYPDTRGSGRGGRRMGEEALVSPRSRSKSRYGGEIEDTLRNEVVRSEESTKSAYALFLDSQENEMEASKEFEKRVEERNQASNRIHRVIGERPKKPSSRNLDEAKANLEESKVHLRGFRLKERKIQKRLGSAHEEVLKIGRTTPTAPTPGVSFGGPVAGAHYESKLKEYSKQKKIREDTLKVAIAKRDAIVKEFDEHQKLIANTRRMVTLYEKNLIVYKEKLELDKKEYASKDEAFKAKQSLIKRELKKYRESVSRTNKASKKFAKAEDIQKGAKTNFLKEEKKKEKAQNRLDKEKSRRGIFQTVKGKRVKVKDVGTRAEAEDKRRKRRKQTETQKEAAEAYRKKMERHKETVAGERKRKKGIYADPPKDVGMMSEDERRVYEQEKWKKNEAKEEQKRLSKQARRIQAERLGRGRIQERIDTATKGLKESEKPAKERSEEQARKEKRKLLKYNLSQAQEEMKQAKKNFYLKGAEDKLRYEQKSATSTPKIKGKGFLQGPTGGKISTGPGPSGPVKMEMVEGKWVNILAKGYKETKKGREATERAAASQGEATEAAKGTVAAIEKGKKRPGVAAGEIGYRSAMDRAVVSAIRGFSEGGVVPGQGKGDTVPAWLEPGEVVLSNKMLNNARGYKNGGIVAPSPSLALAAGGSGGGPNIALNVRGDSVNNIMRNVQGQLASVLNRMMSPTGTSGRFFDLTQSG